MQNPEQHWRSEQPAKPENLSQDRRCRPVRKDETQKKGGYSMMTAVLSSIGVRLMPTTCFKARKLIESGKAVIHSYDPFTIRLTQRENGGTQPIEYCCDTQGISISGYPSNRQSTNMSVYRSMCSRMRRSIIRTRKHTEEHEETEKQDTEQQDLTTERRQSLKAGLHHPSDIRKISILHRYRNMQRYFQLQVLYLKWANLTHRS